MSSLRSSDYGILAAFCLVLFGFALVDGRTLTTHETVHCQNTREMRSDGDWIIPHYGGRPWLERPPLPFWITASFVAVLGDADGVYLLTTPLLGTGIVLTVAWTACRWIARPAALLAGGLLASTDAFRADAIRAQAG